MPQRRTKTPQSKKKKQKKTTTTTTTTVLSSVPALPSFGQYTLKFVNRNLLKDALNEYQYISPPKTFCERLCLVRFWNAVADVYPAWLAPNTVTLCGYVCAVVVLLLTLVYSPNFPSWYYLVTAFLMFLYQTADGSDGPQARRLKCGSALGELFDHGVDAVVTSLMYYACTEISGTRITSPFAPIIFSCSASAFFFSNASLLHTSRQLFNDLDAQELQIGAQLAMVATWWFGPASWATPLPLPRIVAQTIGENLPSVAATIDLNVDESTILFRGALNLAIVCFTIANSINACQTVRAHYATSKKKVMITGRTLEEFWQQVRSMLFLFFLFGLSWYTTASAVQKSSDDAKYAFRLWFLSCTFAYADLVNHVLVLRVAKIPMPTMIRTRSFWLMSLFAVWTEFCNRGDTTNPLVQYSDFGRFIVCIACFGSHIYYSTTVGTAIANGLGVSFFTVPIAKQKSFLKTKQSKASN